MENSHSGTPSRSGTRRVGRIAGMVGVAGILGLGAWWMTAARSPDFAQAPAPKVASSTTPPPAAPVLATIPTPPEAPPRDAAKLITEDAEPALLQGTAKPPTPKALVELAKQDPGTAAVPAPPPPPAPPKAEENPFAGPGSVAAAPVGAARPQAPVEGSRTPQARQAARATSKSAPDAQPPLREAPEDLMATLMRNIEQPVPVESSEAAPATEAPKPAKRESSKLKRPESGTDPEALEELVRQIRERDAAAAGGAVMKGASRNAP